MTEEHFELSVTAFIRSSAGRGSLSVDERVELPAGDFDVISRVLGRFHGFADRLRAEILEEDQDDVAAAAAEPDRPGHCDGCGNDDGPSWCEGGVTAVDEVQALLQLSERAHMDLVELVDEILSNFTDRGHPGRPCVRTLYVTEEKLAEWRSKLIGQRRR